MKITFIGATHEVTGSCYYLEAAGKKFLVDCGMEQGPDYYENQDIPVKGSDLDFVLLTHAHMDHSGNLPAIYAKGFQGPIYATQATCHLCDIMLRDSAHIQMFEQSGVTVKDAARASRNLFLLTPWKMLWALSRILFRARMKKHQTGRRNQRSFRRCRPPSWLCKY